MALTADELAAARRAIAQNAEYDKSRKYAALLTLIMALWLAMKVMDWMVNLLRPEDLILLCALLAGQLYRYKRDQFLKSRYSANQLLLEELRLREGDSFDHAVGPVETTGEYPPLLERWNRRLEQRALLWRVDEFLSRGRKAS